MTVAELAAKMIQVFEGCKLKAYWDKDGRVWTIGFGHTRGVKEGDTCTLEQATTWLAQDCAPLISLVEGRPLIEAAALVSFGYNCGVGALRQVIGGAIQIKGGQFIKNGSPFGETSGGNQLPGLVARRALEASLIEASRGLL